MDCFCSDEVIFEFVKCCGVGVGEVDVGLEGDYLGFEFFSCVKMLDYVVLFFILLGDVRVFFYV